ncbi:PucR family transcriptional regulator [Paenibacillus aceris]|uniref:Purine catabolism regulator n=1 Tax=Paenibacillus aceris TaxID=869555 RepID=A0ABS4I6S8_9BACL|nr:PucR family transcriptional regulator [Paenibacillus aceris]MBP1966617.1 purine catabolism regulator [Paenibacillus aceris]NHW38853.1 PucR family transcriptional regulator [Paenibacillus aceris]
MNGISVSELIAHKPFLFGEDPIISGTNGLNRRITNVNVMEVPDVFNWVRHGDLLLTTAYSIKDNPNAQNELIPKLAETGIAAIGIKTKRYLETVPKEMIALSNSYELPILELAYQIGYSQTISEVLEEILNQRANWLMEQHHKIQLLTSTLIMGENSKTFLETFAKSTGLHAALITFQSDVYTTDSTFTKEWPEARDLRPVAQNSNATAFPCYWIGDDTTKIYLPIEKNNETMAYFVCWGCVQSELESLQLLFQHTVNLLTLHLSKQHSLRSLEDNQKDLFLKTWILGEINDPQTIALQAASCGLQLQSSYSVCLTSPLPPFSTRELMNIKAYCVIQGIILLSMGNEWVFLMPKTLTSQKDLYVKLLSELHKCLKQTSIRLGISSMKDISDMHEGYKETVTALELWDFIQPGETLCYYEQLGMYPIVHVLSDQESIKKQLFQYIQPLYTYDKENNAKLVETLITYLQFGGNIKETAKASFCHYNSIVYRLERVQSLLGIDLKDPDVRFQLQMAVKVFAYSIKKGTMMGS